MTIKEWIKKDEVMDIIKGLPQDLWEEYIFMLKGVWCDEDMHLETLQVEPKTKCVARIELDTEEVVRRIKEEYDITDGWIPCSERLPNKNEWGYYLVTVKGTRLFVDVVPFNEKLWKGLSSNQEVLAWMPLPKPYRKDDEA